MQKLWLFTLILLIAAGLRLHNLDAQSVWFDEGWSAYAAAQPSPVAAALADATNPPLYYLLIYLTATFTGTSVFALRWLSFALGMVAVALSIQLGRQAGGRAGVWAGIAAAVSLPMVWASQEMRMYTLLAVLVGVMIWAWERVRTAPTRRAWVVLALAEIAILYAHNTGPVIVLAVNLLTVGAWIVYCQPSILRWVAVQAAVVIVWLPYFVTRFLNVAGANAVLIRRTRPSLETWAGLWLAPWEAVTDAPLLIIGLTAGALLLLIPALADACGRWRLAYLLITILGMLAALAVLGNPFHGRYLIAIMPILAALVGGGMGRMRRPLAVVALVYLLVIFGIGYRWLYSPAYRHDDARAMVAHYAATLGADDTVLAWSYADRYDLAYYWERLGVAAARVTLPEGATQAEIVPLLPQSGDVSLNVWYTQRADYRGMADCLLAHGTPTPPEHHQVNGMATRTYRAPALLPPEERPVRATFTIADVLATGTLPGTFQANQAVCLPVTVRLTAPTPDELQAAITLTNAQGIEIISVSSVFATPNGRTSTDGTLGDTLTAYPVLRLPPGTPPGVYDVRLRLFDSVMLSGYDLLRAGAPVGKDADIGQWTIQAGARWPGTAQALTLTQVTPNTTAANNGDTLTFELTWHGTDTIDQLPGGLLRATDGSWRVSVPPSVTTFDNRTIEWRQAQLPLDAAPGETILTVEGWGEVGRVQVNTLPVLDEQPPSTPVTGAVFPGVGEIVGYNWLGPTEAGYALDLIWQAGASAPPDRDYTVFVQFLNGQGELIGQSDAPPAGGVRPTTGWRAGEFIVDRHVVRLNSASLPEPMQIIAGLYDREGRVLLTDGGDAAILPQPNRR
jgi:hypothetical protein